MFWIWLTTWTCVVAALLVGLAICSAFAAWMDKKVFARFPMSRCRKCGELLGPQKLDTFHTYPGANLHYRIICGNCGARFTYDQWGEPEPDQSEWRGKLIHKLLKKAGWPEERINILTEVDVAGGAPQSGVLVQITSYSADSRHVCSEAIRVLLRDEFQGVPVFFIERDEYNAAVRSGSILPSLRDQISHAYGDIFWLSNGALVEHLDVHSTNREQKIAAFTQALRDS